ncbi:MAG: septal ring lytic transglycosylase RlpA family protein [Methylobacter sp.]
MRYQTIQYNESSLKDLFGNIITSPSINLSVRKRLLGFFSLTLICALGLFGYTSEHSSEQTKPANEQAIQGQQKESSATVPVHKEVGEASWYGPGFQGKETSSGETFDQKKMTAAHPSLPIGTKVEVTNLENDKKVEVKINDRGPYVDNRAIDLSSAAADKLKMKRTAQFRSRL